MGVCGEVPGSAQFKLEEVTPLLLQEICFLGLEVDLLYADLFHSLIYITTITIVF